MATTTSVVADICCGDGGTAGRQPPPPAPAPAAVTRELEIGAEARPEGTDEAVGRLQLHEAALGAEEGAGQEEEEEEAAALQCGGERPARGCPAPCTAAPSGSCDGLPELDGAAARPGVSTTAAEEENAAALQRGGKWPPGGCPALCTAALGGSCDGPPEPDCAATRAEGSTAAADELDDATACAEASTPEEELARQSNSSSSSSSSSAPPAGDEQPWQPETAARPEEGIPSVETKVLLQALEEALAMPVPSSAAANGGGPETPPGATHQVGGCSASSADEPRERPAWRDEAGCSSQHAGISALLSLAEEETSSQQSSPEGGRCSLPGQGWRLSQIVFEDAVGCAGAAHGEGDAAPRHAAGLLDVTVGGETRETRSVPRLDATEPLNLAHLLGDEDMPGLQWASSASSPGWWSPLGAPGAGEPLDAAGPQTAKGWLHRRFAQDPQTLRAMDAISAAMADLEKISGGSLSSAGPAVERPSPRAAPSSASACPFLLEEEPPERDADACGLPGPAAFGRLSSARRGAPREEPHGRRDSSCSVERGQRSEAARECEELGDAARMAEEPRDSRDSSRSSLERRGRPEAARRAECEEWRALAEEAQRHAEGAESLAERAREELAVEEARLAAERGARSELEEQLAAICDDKEFTQVKMLNAAQAAEAFLRQRTKRLEDERSRIEREAADADRQLLDQIAQLRAGEEEAQREREDAVKKRHAAETSLLFAEQRLCRKKQDILCDEASEAARRKHFEFVGRCSKARETKAEPQDLGSELRDWIQDELERELRSKSSAEESVVARRGLEEARERADTEATEMERAALEDAWRKVQVARQNDEEVAKCEREAAESEARVSEERMHQESLHRRELIGAPQTLPEPLLRVRIPRFNVVESYGPAVKVNYTIIVQSAGGSSRITKTFKEFKQLKEELARRPFEPSLREHLLPPENFLVQFSMSRQDSQRQQLEAYLAFLCSHTHVMLEECFWRWLGLDGLGRAAARLAAAGRVQWLAEVSRSVERMDALVSEDSNPAAAAARCCAQPRVPEALCGALCDAEVPAAQLAAGRLLRRALGGDPRTRRLLLPWVRGAAAALVAVARGRCGGCARPEPRRPSAGGGGGERLAGDEDAAEPAAACTRCKVAYAAEQAVLAVLDPAHQAQGAAAADGEDGPPRDAPEADGDGEAAVGLCVVCRDASRTHALLPCGHLCACLACSAFLTTTNSSCPQCRGLVARAVHVFV